MDWKNIWQSALLEIETQVSKPTFATWFKDTHIVKIEEGTVVLSVPNAFTRDWLRDKFHTTILRPLRALDPSIHAVEYVVNKEEARRREDKPSDLGMRELPLREAEINKDDNLNPRYTFETFVIGPFNELAHAAAQAVVRNPGITYNPLFIYGSTGHGKTHLIQAIGNHIKKTFPNKRVYYMTSDKFVQEVMNAFQTSRFQAFKEKYRKYDVFIMDDIQFLSGNKDRCQEELFHLFNALYDNNKQIIFSSDKHPHFIQGLEDRLKSRFAAGMIIDIPQPDHESRMAILSKKAAQLGIALSPEIIDFLAGAVAGNIRDLEGTVNILTLHSQSKGDITLSEARNIIKNTAKPKKIVAIKDIVKIVSDFYSIEEESIYEKTRRKEVIKPRQVIMYLLREDFNFSYPSIGQKLGGRDHTTVIHSCEKIKTDLKGDQGLESEVSQIRNLLSV